MARRAYVLALLAVLSGCESKSTTSGEPVGCEPGDSMQRPCGNCGTMTKLCPEGAWGEWSECTGQGECAAGAQDSRACGSDVGACALGTMVRTCSDTCAWNVWGSCQGDVKPAAETCGNGTDENCNGESDEGCTCNPAALGAGGSFEVSGQITKLVAHPDRCLLYALDAGTPSQVVVIDADQKLELTRIPLPRKADDLSLSPDGTRMVVSHDAAHEISVIDPLRLELTGTLSVQSDPYAVEVTDGGKVYYAEVAQWCDIRAVTLATGADVLLNSWGNYAPDLELSSDGRFLFAGEAGISGGTLTKYDVSGATATAVDESTWDDGYGFPYPARHVYLSPGGQHVYYAGYQLDAGHLGHVLGRVGELVFAEDPAGTFAVGSSSIHDAALVKPVASLPSPVTAAALAANGTELWTYGAGRVSYQNIGDLIDPATLGKRELEPEPLSSYTLSILVADPIRPRLYGLDVARELVVAIDADTLEPLGAVVVASLPSDLEVALDGAALYVAHRGALSIARIDLTSFSFDGFIPTPRVNADIEVLAQGRLATIDWDQWTTPTLIDLASGQVLDELWGFYGGALAATEDGTSLFVGESGISGGNIARYDVSTGQFTKLTESTYNGGYGFPYPAWSVVAVPDGSGVYYAGYLLNGNDLSLLRYPQSDRIQAVTPDGRLASSGTTVFRVADGAALGTLPVSRTVQATSPDGATLYLAGEGSITKVDLTVY